MLLDIKCVTDHEQFWKTIKPFFSEKSKTSSNNTLKNHEIIISNNEKKLEEFNSFFENTVKSLNIKLSNFILGDITNLSNPVEIAIKKFENNPSVQIIKNNINVGQALNFKQIELNDIIKEIKNLDDNENGTFTNISSKQLHYVASISAP